ncbi:MAG: cation:proton antiporter, partial [Sandaracinaceae bacterium]|nr:cation:proton antiporter [Sandaracinaceae bacterium]
MSGGQHGGGGGIRKMLIVLLLVGGLILVHRFASRTVGFDPSGMLSLGFVILVSYAFGEIVGRIKLPHLTGYIIAGLALGPSTAELIPTSWRVPPFDHGVLNEDVIDQMRPLVTLAVALIALTAGGSLKIDALRRGLRAILSILGSQMLIVSACGAAFFLGVSGLVPSLRLPGIGDLDTGSMLALAGVVGSIATLTSPSATVAVVSETKSAGTFTSQVLGVVVLKAISAVVLFSIASTLAAIALGEGSGERSLGLYLLQHVGGSLLSGAILGVAIALYVRFIKAELLIFLVGVVFTATFVASALDLEPILLFIATGFVAGNLSREGDQLLVTVEKLSLPVYVVFFTLAGARLHIHELFTLLPFVAGFVLLRALGIVVGTRVGAAIGGVGAGMRRYGWMAFVSQAGVTISLAGIVGRSFGERGRAIETLLIAVCAIHELVGPVLLKLSLGFAGETR